MTLDHLCHDPDVCRLGIQCPHRRCVNVNHLEPVTAEENKRRGSAGRPQADKTQCPKGHPYSGDNLLVCRGRRYCRKCRRDAEAERRSVAKVANCKAAGHERQSAISADGRDYCVICIRKAAGDGGKTRWDRVRKAA